MVGVHYHNKNTIILHRQYITMTAHYTLSVDLNVLAVYQ